MDICRGQMLPQLWTDTPYLYPAGREQMAMFIALVKANPACFSKSHFIIGNPWKNEPYGYSCTDGNRAFIAINNGVWHNSAIPLEFNSQWGLPEHGQWDIYRWYPEPALLQTTTQKPIMAMQPFEVILLEIVPQGVAASLNRQWKRMIMPHRVRSRFYDIELDVIRKSAVTHAVKFDTHEYRIQVKLPVRSENSCLAITAEFFKDKQQFLTLWNPNLLVARGTSNGKILNFQPTINSSIGTWYPSCWQTWRLDIPKNSILSELELNVQSSLPTGVELQWHGYLIPSAHILNVASNDTWGEVKNAEKY